MSRTVTIETQAEVPVNITQLPDTTLYEDTDENICMIHTLFPENVRVFTILQPGCGYYKGTHRAEKVARHVQVKRIIGQIKVV